MSIVLIATVLLLPISVGSGALAQNQPLAFEVASIKPSKPGSEGGGIRPLPGGQTYIASNVPLRLMIKLMYKITDSQIVGGPSWIDTER